jgi:pyruvate formate lyase activating enzyme
MKRSALACACCAGLPGPAARPLRAAQPGPEEEGDPPPGTVASPGAVEALHYDKLENMKVACRLCPRECQVADRERGYCGVRENRERVYFTLVHSNVCALNVDPIEKKPVFHFLPGSKAYSIATAGCNIECKFCQNWEISQFRPEQVRSVRLSPEKVARLAKAERCRSIAYTYSEPVVFYEYMLDCCKAGHKESVKSVMISNGYIKEKPLRELVLHLDAVKIDLKAFTEKFYRELCSGELAPVLKTLEILKDEGIWFEIVVLIIPFQNDSREEVKSMCGWIVEKLGDSVPVHFTRFHPTYKIKDLPRTPLETLEGAYDTALEEGLKFAYIGNVPGHEAENTRCPSCGKVVIERTGFRILDKKITSGACAFCSEKIPGVWE